LSVYKRILASLLFLILTGAPLKSQVVHTKYFDRFSHYSIDDWITYAYANHITSIDVGSDYVYFGTTQGGILRFDVFDQSWDFPFTVSSGLRSNTILRLSYDPLSDQLYARTPEGIDVYNKAFRYWERASVSELPRQRTPQDFQRGNDFRYPPYSRPGLDVLNNFFTDGQYDYLPRGTVISPENYRYEVTDMVVDFRNTLWIGTSGAGIGNVDLDGLTMHFEPRSVAAISPNDLLFDGDYVWIAGDPLQRPEAAITRWDSYENSWQFFREGIYASIISLRINTIEWFNGNVFFGSDRGLFYFDTRKGSWQRLRNEFVGDDFIFDLQVVDSVLFAATESGLLKISKSLDFATEVSPKLLRHSSVYQLAAADGEVYLATDRGLFVLDSVSAGARFLATGSAVSDLFLTAVGVQNDTVWFAGSGGVAMGIPDERDWRSFPGVRLSVTSRINDIAFSGENVWFASNSGLIKYDKARDYWYLYTEQDGLPSPEIRKIDVAGDDLWLSTAGGITVFRWNEPGREE